MKNEPKINEEAIQDIDLSEIQRKKFRINGQSSKIIELNTSDMRIAARLKEAYPKLDKITNRVIESDAFLDVDNNPEAQAEMQSAEREMRDLIDFIFDYPVSDVCVEDGSMFDPINGKFKFEHVIETLAELYTNNFADEVKKIQARTKKHTAKYTKKK